MGCHPDGDHLRVGRARKVGGPDGDVMVSDGACPPLDFTFRIDGQAGGKTGGGKGGGSVKRTDGCGNGRSGFGIDRTDFRSGQLSLIKRTSSILPLK